VSYLHLDKLNKLFILNHINLVQENNQLRHADLPRE